MDELIELRRKRSKTFRLDNGQFQTEVGNHSHVLKNGLFVPINSTLDNETGKDPDIGFDYAVSNHSTQHPFYVKFGTDDPAYLKLRDVETGKMIVFKPRDNNNKPDHTTEGNKVTVVDVWPGIDMEIYLTDVGIKTNYRIKTSDGQRIVEYDVEGDMAAFRMQAPWYTLPDVIRPIVVPNAFSNGVLSYDFRNVPIGTLVDPTVTIQPDETTGDDTFIDSSDPTSSYEHYSTILLLGSASGPSTSDRILLKIPITDIPVGQTITSAILSMTCNSASYGGGPPDLTDFYMHRLLVSFAEATATWNVRSTGVSWGTAGASGSGTDVAATQTAMSSYVHAAATHSWDVTTDVAGFYAGTYTNYGWRLRCTGENTNPGTSVFQYRPMDHVTVADRPKLVVISTEATVATTTTTKNPYPFGGGPNKPFQWRR